MTCHSKRGSLDTSAGTKEPAKRHHCQSKNNLHATEDLNVKESGTFLKDYDPNNHQSGIGQEELSVHHQTIIDQLNEGEPSGLGNWSLLLGLGTLGALPLCRRDELLDQE